MPNVHNQVYPQLTNSNVAQVNRADTASERPQKKTSSAYLLALQAEKKGLEKHLELVTDERDDLRRRLDEEIEERRRLIAALVEQRKRSLLQRLGLRR